MTEEVLQLLSDDPMVVLNRGYRAKERIAARQKRIEEWRQIAESITANPENASSGGSYPTSKTLIEDAITEKTKAIAVVHYAGVSCAMDEIMEIADFERQTSQIIKELVEDLNFKTVLELRYLSYLRWEEIAVRMNYTFRWTQELHRRALLALQEAASALIPA